MPNGNVGSLENMFVSWKEASVPHQRSLKKNVKCVESTCMGICEKKPEKINDTWRFDIASKRHENEKKFEWN